MRYTNDLFIVRMDSHCPSSDKSQVTTTLKSKDDKKHKKGPLHNYTGESQWNGEDHDGDWTQTQSWLFSDRRTGTHLLFKFSKTFCHTCRFFLHTLTAAKASCICFLRASLCRLYAISINIRKIPATIPPATSMKTPKGKHIWVLWQETKNLLCKACTVNLTQL